MPGPTFWTRSCISPSILRTYRHIRARVSAICPSAVLVNVMKGHQRYIPLEKEKGLARPGFIFFANTQTGRIPREVARGTKGCSGPASPTPNSFLKKTRRLASTRFTTGSTAVKFHKKLGNLKDKGRKEPPYRRALLASAWVLTFDGKIDRAAMLIKADLLSHMVGEFPELQGTMGRIYAEHQGEDKEVAQSIEEHYFLPRHRCAAARKQPWLCPGPSG